MGTALIKLQIMPMSVEKNLEEIKDLVKGVIESNKGANPMFEEEPVAFGLKALIAGFSLDEDFELEPIENAISDLEDISSVKVIDMRRAFG